MMREKMSNNSELTLLEQILLLLYANPSPLIDKRRIMSKIFLTVKEIFPFIQLPHVKFEFREGYPYSEQVEFVIDDLIISGMVKTSNIDQESNASLSLTRQGIDYAEKIKSTVSNQFNLLQKKRLEWDQLHNFQLISYIREKYFKDKIGSSIPLYVTVNSPYTPISHSTTVTSTSTFTSKKFLGIITGIIIVVSIGMVPNLVPLDTFSPSPIGSPTTIPEYEKLSVDELLIFGTRAADEGRYTSAERFYQVVLEKEQNNVEALNGLGYVLTEQNRIDEAQLYYDQVLQLKPDDINANNGVGYALVKQEEFEKAIPFFKFVLEKDSDNVNGHNGLGLAYTGLGDYDAATEEFNISLGINPNKTETINGLAFVNYRTEQYSSAESLYQKVLSIDDSNADALKGLILVLTAQDKLDKVQSLLVKITETDQSVIDELIKEGEYLNGIGEYNKASELFEKIILIEPNNIDALYGKALSLYEIKQYEESAYIVSQILEIDENHDGAISLKDSMINDMGQ